ncbi:MAG: SMP-30/gluconolactonase/LRE family protein [Rhodospirillaceae bacterium]|jgi:xylono-1,5-lactonase|nr:SMP-30/gluconolactonase/LRE family protein [Rhodospirillaceae bacterium]
MEAICISDERALLGESPVWSASDNAIYWIDILSKRLHRTTLENGKTSTWNLPSCPGMIAMRRKGGLVVALEDGLYEFSPLTGKCQLLVSIEADKDYNRPNDGKCDACGRLWLGTMNKVDPNRETGSFYRIDPDLTVTKIASQYRIPNGIAWSPDNEIMYHADTRKSVVWTYDFHLQSGQLSKQRDFFIFDRSDMGGVDGAAIDMEGGYWAAMYGGGQVVCRLPSGEIDHAVKLPVTQPTMPAFGGPDMTTLFVTSARQKLSDRMLSEQPMAGGLLAISTDTKGGPVHSFGG